MRRITAIATNTLLELVRQKVFYFMLVFALIGIGVSFVFSGMPFAEQFPVLKRSSLGTMSIFSFLLATLATAMILPKDLEDRTLYTVLAKPVSRLHYLLGKLLGVYLLLAVAMALMSAFFLVALYAREHLSIAEVIKEYGTSPDGQAAVAEIKKQAFGWNFPAALLITFTKAAICAALTLMISSFATSWIFTVMVSVVVFIIGHVQPVAREYWLAQSGVNPSPLMKVFFAFVSLGFPDFQLFDVVDEIAVGNVVPGWMLLQTGGLGLGYIIVYGIIGYVFFANREL
jgi:ABC-type transport system involved in multi-copper enzyme maturation permease subunit